MQFTTYNRMPSYATGLKAKWISYTQPFTKRRYFSVTKPFTKRRYFSLSLCGKEKVWRMQFTTYNRILSYVTGLNGIIEN